MLAPVVLTLLAASQALPQARELEEAGQESEAIRLLQREVVAHPQDLELRLEAARLRLKVGEELGAAQLDLEAARVLAPQDPRPHFLWASLMEEQGKPWEAAKSLERVLVVQPGDAEARFRVASMYERLGDLLHAEFHYRRLARTRPDWAVARVQLAAVLEAEDRREDAIKELEGLLAEQPASALARRKLAELYERAGRLKDAQAIREPMAAPQAPKLRPLKRSKR